MEKGSISIDALVSMILIISLVGALQAMVGSQQDYVNIYGGRIQTDYISMQYGSMINNYYALNPDTDLIVDQPVIKLFSKELRQEPSIGVGEGLITINAYDYPTYPIPNSFKHTNLVVIKK